MYHSSTAISKTLNDWLAKSLTAVIYISLLATEKEEVSDIKGSMGDGKGAKLDRTFWAPQTWSKNNNCCIYRVPERYASISTVTSISELRDRLARDLFCNAFLLILTLKLCRLIDGWLIKKFSLSFIGFEQELVAIHFSKVEPLFQAHFQLKSRLCSSIINSFVTIKSFWLKVWPSTAVAMLHCLENVHWSCPLSHWVIPFQVSTVFGSVIDYTLTTQSQSTRSQWQFKPFLLLSCGSMLCLVPASLHQE